MASSRFVVGIDLGTTNCALAFVDTSTITDDQPASVQSFPIPQLVAPGELGERPVLPSFLYLAAQDEFPEKSLILPFGTNLDHRIVGQFARDHGMKVPGRLVSSAKSWLSQTGTDPRTPLLPRNAPEGLAPISPVEVSSAYLGHLRDAWNDRFAQNSDDLRLEHQDVILTVPASFDPVARELTLEAARSVGLQEVTLLEEPQAAFYAWIAAEGDRWRDQVSLGDLILVCDVGGGTTDFTLIRVGEADGDLTLNRIAVGEHILLGGDNMDLALAYAVAAKIPGGMEGLDPTRQLGLVYSARNAKEALLSDPNLQEATVTVLGRGSRVIGGSLKTKLTRIELETVILNGFFPPCEIKEEPIKGRRLGLAEIGLPYATDPAITKHLAHFLNRQSDSIDIENESSLPKVVLFNGGVFQASALRARITELLTRWSDQSVGALDADQLDQAVALGSAYYGIVRRGSGIRIRGGVARSYYVGIEGSAPAVPGIPPPIKALCVVPMGMEEGTQSEVPGSELGLYVGESVEFRFLSSNVRRQDKVGTLLDRWLPDELQELTPLVTRLDEAEGESGAMVPIHLLSHVTEIGTLDLWCQATRSAARWKLEYNVRDQ